MTREGPLSRANAIGYLSRFSADRRVFPAFEWALGDEHPMIRATAALLMPGSAAHKPAAINALAAALNDKVATVRLAAVVSLVGMGVRDFKPPLAQPFLAAMKLYQARAALNTDDAGQLLAAGRFFLLTGNPAKASESFGASLKLDPDSPAQYFLASAYAQLGKYEEARPAFEQNIAVTGPGLTPKVASPAQVNRLKIDGALGGLLPSNRPEARRNGVKNGSVARIMRTSSFQPQPIDGFTARAKNEYKALYSISAHGRTSPARNEASNMSRGESPEGQKVQGFIPIAD